MLPPPLMSFSLLPTDLRTMSSLTSTMVLRSRQCQGTPDPEAAGGVRPGVAEEKDADVAVDEGRALPVLLLVLYLGPPLFLK